MDKKVIRPWEANPMRSRTAPKAWLTQFLKDWNQRTGGAVEGLSPEVRKTLISQAHSLYQVGFTAKRAAWMAAPLPWEGQGTEPLPAIVPTPSRYPTAGENPLLMVMTNPSREATARQRLKAIGAIGPKEKVRVEVTDQGEAFIHRPGSAYPQKYSGVLDPVKANPMTALTPADRKAIRDLVSKTDVWATSGYVTQAVLDLLGQHRTEQARRQMASYARAMFKRHQAPYLANPLRWVVTYVRDGQRRLFDPMQGRYTYATKVEAQERLDAFRDNGDLLKVMTPQEIKSMEVRQVDAYEGHYDPKTMWFDNPGAAYHKKKLKMAKASSANFQKYGADRPATFYDGKAQAEQEALQALSLPGWKRTIPLDKATAEREEKNLKELGLKQVRVWGQGDGSYIVYWKDNRRSRKNPGGAAQGKLYSMKLGLYPSYNVNLASLIAEGKFAGLKARAIQMGYVPQQSKTGYPWPGIYFMSKAGDVLVLETVPPSHMMFPIEESEYSPEEQALRKKYSSKNPVPQLEVIPQGKKFLLRVDGRTVQYGTRKEVLAALRPFQRKFPAYQLSFSKNPSRATRLKAEARESAKFRGHKLGQFRQTGENVWVADCTRPKCSAMVSVHPGFSYEVIGDAVAVGCPVKESNPGADWHQQRAREEAQAVKAAKTEENRNYHHGRYHEALDSAHESRIKGMKNPAKAKRSVPRNKGAAWGQLVPLTQYKQKRWVVTVPYFSGKKKTFLFSAPDMAAAKKKLMDMWFEGKFVWKGEQPTRAGWAVREVGKK